MFNNNSLYSNINSVYSILNANTFCWKLHLILQNLSFSNTLGCKPLVVSFEGNWTLIDITLSVSRIPWFTFYSVSSCSSSLSKLVSLFLNENIAFDYLVPGSNNHPLDTIAEDPYGLYIVQIYDNHHHNVSNNMIFLRFS